MNKTLFSNRNAQYPLAIIYNSCPLSTTLQKKYYRECPDFTEQYQGLTLVWYIKTFGSGGKFWAIEVYDAAKKFIFRFDEKEMEEFPTQILKDEVLAEIDRYRKYCDTIKITSIA